MPSLLKAATEPALNADRLRRFDKCIHLSIESFKCLEGTLTHLGSYDLCDSRTGGTSLLEAILILHHARPIRKLTAVGWARLIDRALILAFKESAAAALLSKTQALMTCPRISHAAQESINEGVKLHAFCAREAL